MKRFMAVVAVAACLAAGSFAGTWWAHRSGASGASAHAATVYTCPMHPDYRSDHPGDCPICGMRLEADRAGGAADGDAAAPAHPDGAVRRESRRAAGDRRPGRRRQPGGRHPARADDGAGGARREPDVSDRRRRERLDPLRRERHDGRRREEGPGARVVRRARGRVQERSAVVLHHPRGVLSHGAHAAAAAAGAATGAVAPLLARPGGDRADGRRAADPRRLQRAAPGDGPAPRARARHPRGVAGGRRRAEARRLARPPVRSRLRALPDRGPEPRVDPGRRVPRRPAAHPPGGGRADHHGPGEPGAAGDGEPVGADLRRGDAHAQGAARGGEPGGGAQARHARRRRVRGRPPAGARRAGGCDRGLGAAQDGVRRPRPRALRAATGRDGVARRRRRRGDERAHARRADRHLGHLLRRFREPHEGGCASGIAVARARSGVRHGGGSRGSQRGRTHGRPRRAPVPLLLGRLQAAVRRRPVALRERTVANR